MIVPKAIIKLIKIKGHLVLANSAITAASTGHAELIVSSTNQRSPTKIMSKVKRLPFQS
jgi:hypothetical protein